MIILSTQNDHFAHTRSAQHTPIFKGCNEVVWNLCGFSELHSLKILRVYVHSKMESDFIRIKKVSSLLTLFHANWSSHLQNATRYWLSVSFNSCWKGILYRYTILHISLYVEIRLSPTCCASFQDDIEGQSVITFFTSSLFAGVHTVG